MISDYPVKSPRKLIEVALPLDAINAACFFDEQLTACSLLDPVPNRLVVKTHFLTHLGNAFIIRGQNPS